MEHATGSEAGWPRLNTVGVDGWLVSFADRLSEPANRAALAFRHALDEAGLEGIEETSTSLSATYVRFDALRVPHATIRQALEALLAERDWMSADLPVGRKLWRIPTVYGTDLAPQLEEAASMAGLSPEAAVTSLSQTRVRVRTIGFGPGQPYLGQLPEAWDIPRQTALTDKVPAGALTVAIRQFVLFSISAPTGWRHVGQTALTLFRPDDADPFVLRPGDEVMFVRTGRAAFEAMRQSGPDAGATWEALT